MTSYSPPKKNAAYITYIGLGDSANRPQYRVNPTIAAGDFQVSIDGGAFANLATLPTVTPAGGRTVKISLSAGEMNGDNIVVQGVDAAGAEWDDNIFSLQTVSTQFDDIGSRIPTALDANGFIKSDVEAWKAGVVPSPAVTGVPKVDLTYILGALLSGNASRIGFAFTNFFDQISPTGTVNSIPNSVAGTPSGLAIVGSNVGTAAGVSGNIGGNIIGRVLGTGATAFVGVGVQADVEQWAAGAVPTPAVTGVPKTDPTYIKGGAIPTPAVTGVPKVDLTYILGTILTETAGLLAAGFKKFFNVASPTGTLNSLPDAVPGAAGGLVIDGSNASIQFSNLDVAGDMTIGNELRAETWRATDVVIANEIFAAAWSGDASGLTGIVASGAPTANENADAYLDRAGAVDGYTPRQILRVEAAVLAGKVSGGPQHPLFRAIDDSKVRVDSVADGFGDRTSVAIDAS